MDGVSTSSTWAINQGLRGGVRAFGHAYGMEDLTELNRILGQQYHVVVGNPPYITVKDRGPQSSAYRKAVISTCHQKVFARRAVHRTVF